MIGPACLAQRDSLFERQACRELTRTISLCDRQAPGLDRVFAIKLRLAVGEGFTPGDRLEMRRSHQRANRDRNEQPRQHSAQDGDRRVAPGPPPVSLKRR